LVGLGIGSGWIVGGLVSRHVLSNITVGRGLETCDVGYGVSVGLGDSVPGFDNCAVGDAVVCAEDFGDAVGAERDVGSVVGALVGLGIGDESLLDDDAVGLGIGHESSSWRNEGFGLGTGVSVRLKGDGRTSKLCTTTLLPLGTANVRAASKIEPIKTTRVVALILGVGVRGSSGSASMAGIAATHSKALRHPMNISFKRSIATLF
jgi:hypothetical protein